MNRIETVSLYDRLGRFDGITRIVHDVMEECRSRSQVLVLRHSEFVLAARAMPTES